MDCVDAVENGKRGAIADNQRLLGMYDISYYDIVQKHLKNQNERVRIEVVLFLTKLKEKQAVDDIEDVRRHDNDNVSSACLAYTTMMGNASKDVPEIMEILKYRNGEEFIQAAARIGEIGTRDHIDELRVIYGQVRGDMKEAMKKALCSIADRYPDLRSKKYLVLSPPVYPNEKEFLEFADESQVFLDIEYRDEIYDRAEITPIVYNDTIRRLRTIQIRIYNERVNLKHYSKTAKQQFSDVEELLIWAIKDIKSKTVRNVGEAPVDKHRCAKCGSKMVLKDEYWICPECGISR